MASLDGINFVIKQEEVLAAVLQFLRDAKLAAAATALEASLASAGFNNLASADR
jgi:hypothetical protein